METPRPSPQPPPSEDNHHSPLEVDASCSPSPAPGSDSFTPGEHEICQVQISSSKLSKKRSGKGFCATMGNVSPCAFANYIQRVGDNYTWRFVFLLCSAYIGLKGTLHGFLIRVQLPYYKTMNLDGIAYQTAAAVGSAPWAMKGALGAFSDGWPLLGYHKKPYMIVTSILGGASVLALAMLPTSTAVAFSWLPALLFMFGNLEVATVDLLCEGKYAEMMAQRPQTGSDIVTFVWMAIMGGKVFSAAVVGPVSDSIGPHAIFWICVPFAFQILVPVFFGYMPEEKVTHKPNSPQFDKIIREKKLFALSMTIQHN
eukprot:GHVQ01001614.1.p1 GENE.GHVQ01001614.1~~GHVQ01001614.1.p1  ORF type:complete len:313 (+),score=50.28 GHVQ01001614.1:821-1759(+)